MTFSAKLKNLMEEYGLTQARVSDLTGISRPNISQYVSGLHEPSRARKQEMARALGVQENYFEEFMPKAAVCEDPLVNPPVPLIAKLMRKSPAWVAQGLQDGRFPWGYAVKLKQWSYWINGKKFQECEGITIPLNESADAS